MGNIEMGLELLLTVLLAVTLLHAVRLQRAIGQLRTQRSGMEDAVAGFDHGARQAEASLLRLRETAVRLDGEISQAAALRDDLAFLSERGGQVADKLEELVRAARGHGTPARSYDPPPSPASVPSPVRSQAERDLVLALRATR